MMKKILLCLVCWGFSLIAMARYTAFECKNLNTYVGYLKKSKKDILLSHPKCNAAALRTALKNEHTKKKWINEIEQPYQEYFGHPSGIFRDCENCISKAPFYRLPSKEERQSEGYVLVLSVDGGGVRGLIPAKILEHIEKQTGVKVSDIFDVFAGTSTGGLIALYLNMPTEEGNAKYNATELVEMYQKMSSKIFSHSSYVRKIRGTGGFFTSRYSAKPFEQLLKKYFRNVTMGQTVNPVLVTSANIKYRKSLEFSTLNLRQRKVFLWEAARATSAAPTYFKPYSNLNTQYFYPDRSREREVDPETGELKPLLPERVKLIDGGVGVNSPSQSAIDLARTIYPNKKILLVSLGNGIYRGKTKFKGSGVFGGGAFTLTDQGPNLAGLSEGMLDIPSDYQEEKAKRDLFHHGGTYIRIEPTPEKDPKYDIPLDDGSPKAMEKLSRISEKMIKDNKELKRLLVLLPSYLQLKRKGKEAQQDLSESQKTFRAKQAFFEKRATRS